MQRKPAPKITTKSSIQRFAKSNAEPVKPTVTKNAILKKAVISFADGVCRNVTDMRDSSKYLSQNVEGYYANVLSEDLETSKQWVEEDISMFVNAFNAVVEFTTGQEHSQELTLYADDLINIALSNEKELKEAGVTVYNGGRVLGFSAERIHNINMLEFGHIVTGASNTAAMVYDRTHKLLQLPAAAHMDFRQLSYYYNYRVDMTAEAALRKVPIALYAGMILDRVI